MNETFEREWQDKARSFTSPITFKPELWADYYDCKAICEAVTKDLREEVERLRGLLVQKGNFIAEKSRERQELRERVRDKMITNYSGDGNWHYAICHWCRSSWDSDKPETHVPDCPCRLPSEDKLKCPHCHGDKQTCGCEV